MSRPAVSVALRPTPLAKEFLRAVHAENVVDLHIREIEPIHRAFRPMVMEAAFDVCELAIVTALQAVDSGKPIIALPITVAARFQHKCIVRNANYASFAPAELCGRRVAVRAYSQTTGFWVRNILEMEYGVASESVTWVTQEAPHVAEAQEPPNVLRDPNGAGPAQLLASGQVDAAIFGNDLPTDSWVRPLIEDPDAHARVNFERSGVAPINHVVAVAKDFAERHPDIVRYVYRKFAASRTQALEEEQLALHPFGAAAMRHSVDVLLRHAAGQRLTTKALTFDDLFGEAVRLLAES